MCQFGLGPGAFFTDIRFIGRAEVFSSTRTVSDTLMQETKDLKNQGCLLMVGSCCNVLSAVFSTRYVYIDKRKGKRQGLFPFHKAECVSPATDGCLSFAFYFVFPGIDTATPLPVEPVQKQMFAIRSPLCCVCNISSAFQAVHGHPFRVSIPSNICSSKKTAGRELFFFVVAPVHRMHCSSYNKNSKACCLSPSPQAT